MNEAENITTAPEQEPDVNPEQNPVESQEIEPDQKKKTILKVAEIAYKTLGSIFSFKFLTDVVAALAVKKGDVYEAIKAAKDKSQIASAAEALVSHVRDTIHLEHHEEQGVGLDVEATSEVGIDFDGEFEDDDEWSVKIRTFNEKIENSNLDEERKAEMREKLRVIVNEGLSQRERIDKKYANRISGVVETYVNSKAKAVGVAKDALNTTLTATGMFALRGLLYGVSAITQRLLKASSEYVRKKEGGEISPEEQKYKFLLMDACKAVVETGRGAFGAGKEAGSSHKVIDFVQAWGNILRGFGIGGMAVDELINEGLTGSITSAVDKIETNIEDNGLAVGLSKSAADNFVANAIRLPNMIKNFFPGDGETLGDSTTLNSEELKDATKISFEEEFTKDHALLESEADAKGFSIENASGKTVVTMEIGADGAYNNLDQALRRLVVDSMNIEDVADSDGFSSVDAARAENVLAIARELLNGNSVGEIDAYEMDDIASYENGKLVILDHAKFDNFMKNLLFRAERIVSDKSDAVFYADKTSQGVWKDMIDTKISSHQDLVNKGVEVQDFSTSGQVRFNNYAEQIQSLYGEGGSVNIDFNNNIVTLNGTDIIIDHDQIIQIGEQHFEKGIPINEDLSINIIKQQLAEYELAHNIDQYAAVVDKIGITNNTGDYLLSPQEFEQLEHLDKITNQFSAEKLAIFEKNHGLVQFASNHRDVNFEYLKVFGEHFSDTALRDGLFKNNEAVNLVINNIDDPKLVEYKVSYLFGLQKQISESLDLPVSDRISLEQIYSLDNENIKIESSDLNNINGVRIDILSSASHKGGALFVDKTGKLSLLSSENKFLGQGRNTHTFYSMDDIFSSEGELRVMYQQLVDKETVQNLLADELKGAADEKGLFAWISVAMDKRYMSGGLNLSATNLASEDTFKTALHEYGQQTFLPSRGQDNNFEKMYSVIQNKTAGDKKAFANFFENNPPGEDETIRQYLGRVVGDDHPPIHVLKPTELEIEVEPGATITDAEPSDEIASSAIGDVDSKYEEFAVGGFTYQDLLGGDEATIREFIIADREGGYQLFEDGKLGKDFSSDLFKICDNSDISNENKIVLLGKMKNVLDSGSVSEDMDSDQLKKVHSLLKAANNMVIADMNSEDVHIGSLDEIESSEEVETVGSFDEVQQSDEPAAEEPKAEVKSEPEPSVEPEVVEEGSIESIEAIDEVKRIVEALPVIDENITVSEIISNKHLASSLYYSDNFYNNVLPGKLIAEPNNLNFKILDSIKDDILKYRSTMIQKLVDQYSPDLENVSDGYALPVEKLDFGTGEGHQDAVDLFIQEGSKVNSMSRGVVILAENGWQEGESLSTVSDNGGNTVVVFNPTNNEFSRYAHLDNVGVEVGDIVAPGDKLGEVGHSGNNANLSGHGGHLHFEINKLNGEEVEHLKRNEIIQELRGVSSESSISDAMSSNEQIEPELVVEEGVEAEPTEINYEALLAKYEFKPVADDKFNSDFAKKIFDTVKEENINDHVIDISNKAQAIDKFAEEFKDLPQQEVLDKQLGMIMEMINQNAELKDATNDQLHFKIEESVLDEIEEVLDNANFMTTNVEPKVIDKLKELLNNF